ncbi:MAG: hypothetical protein J6Q48_09780 [Bacteroidaceae bacterium]|nr:hypothetical protein [Bacteroidaceae bacterium]
MSNPLDNCKVYTLNGIEMIHIAEFAAITKRSIQSTRHLIEDHIGIRKMKFFRDRSRLMIPVAELYGFPLTDKGPKVGLPNIYHYKLVDGEFVKTLCQTCTYGTEMCPERIKAEELTVPEGDK